MEWLIGKRRSCGECTSGRSTQRNMRRALNIVVLGIVALASAAFLFAATHSTHSLVPVARADTPNLTIIVPHPADKHTSGPVGTNITVRAEGLVAGGAYAFGYASADVTCAAGFQSFPNVSQTATASADGKLTITIVWPSNVNSIGTTYYICAQNATQAGEPPVQSVETFRVDAANAPTIDVAAPGATSGAATAAPLPPDGSFYRGGAVTITGHNFLPGGSTLLIAVSAQQLQQPADFQSAAQKPLSTSGGEHTIKSQSSGDFSATVGLPASLAPSSYYLYVFSTDGADQAIPSLVASKQIAIVGAPTPQPTATTAPTATTTGTPPSTGGTTGPHHLKGVLALAVLSILLFIAGVISLLSAAAMPRPGRQ